jgi:ABC-type glycerol-3-phosphate transport system substrate-binding protein
MKNKAFAWLALFASASALIGCAKSDTYVKNTSLDTATPVTLTLTGRTPTFKAMESVITSFCKIYPNCSMQYEYVQDYDNLLTKRLQNNDNVDLFMTENVNTSGAKWKDYTLELFAQRDAGNLDLSDTFDGLVTNFAVNEGKELYVVPLGGEIRGMFVNKGLLQTQGLEVPTNWLEFEACCASLKANAAARAQKDGLAIGEEDHWFIPVQGNPGVFGSLLMYPYVCSLVANSDNYAATYAAVDAAQDGVSEFFREPMARLYDLSAKHFYDYGYVEDNYSKLDDSNLAYRFLGIDQDEAGNYVASQNGGGIPFIVNVMSFKSTLDKVAEDYHANTNYQFILSPVGDDGGFAYLSPSISLAINKNSNHLAWATEFLNYLMSEKTNTAFANEYNILPNTKNVYDTVKKTLGADSKHTCQLGEVTFRYSFWNVISNELKNIAKSNRAKYMKDENTMYPLDYYMSELEASFAKNRVG